MRTGYRFTALLIFAFSVFLSVNVAAYIGDASQDPNFPCFAGGCATSIGKETSNLIVGNIFVFAISAVFFAMSFFTSGKTPTYKEIKLGAQWNILLGLCLAGLGGIFCFLSYPSLLVPMMQVGIVGVAMGTIMIVHGVLVYNNAYMSTIGRKW